MNIANINIKDLRERKDVVIIIIVILVTVFFARKIWKWHGWRKPIMWRLVGNSGRRCHNSGRITNAPYRKFEKRRSGNTSDAVKAGRHGASYVQIYKKNADPLD